MNSRNFGVVGVDWDDVLVDFLGAFIRWVNEAEDLTYDVEDYAHFNLTKSFGGTQKEWWKRIHKFWDILVKDPQYLSRVEGAIESIQQIRKMTKKLIIVTGRPQSHYDHLQRSVEILFPDTFDSLVAIGSNDKIATLKENHVELFIDDRYETMQEVSHTDIIPVFYDGHGTGPDAPASLNRCWQWSEVVRVIQSIDKIR